MKRVIIGGCAAAALTLSVGYAIADTGGSAAKPAKAAKSAPKGPAVNTLSGFELGHDIKSAVAFTGNELIFDGTVTGGPEKARRVVRQLAGGGTIDYVYTPIPVRVTRVHKGTGIKAGQLVRVRALGGSTGDQTTVSELGPKAAEFRPGLTLTLFSQPLLDAGDGLKAITPNFSFGHETRTGTVRSLGGHDDDSTREDVFQQVLTKVK